MARAVARADQMLDEGDMPGAATWHRILDAIERLQAQKPARVSRSTEARLAATGGAGHARRELSLPCCVEF